MKLLINDVIAEIGMEVTDFRGEKWYLVGWTAPHKTSSTGRVYVKKEPSKQMIGSREFFPSVINGKFVEE